ncbi:unnamed protein product [Prunus armeniaca]
MGLRFFLDLGCPTCVNEKLLFTLLHIANLTSLLSSLREILKNSYCLSKRGVVVYPKVDQLLPIVAGLGWSVLGLMRCEPHKLSGYQEEVVAKNVSPLRKKPKLPYAEKTQVRFVPTSSTGVKHLVGADSKKVGGTRIARDVLLKPPADKFENHDLLRRIARA